MKTTTPMLLAMLVGFAGAQCFAANSHAPLSPKIVAAKTVYIENHASAKFADKTYDELKKWGRWEIVDDRTKADLVLVLSAQEGKPSTTQTSTYDPAANNGYGGYKYGTANSYTPGSAHLELLEAGTGQSLYSDTKGSVPRTIGELRKRIGELEGNGKSKR